MILISPHDHYICEARRGLKASPASGARIQTTKFIYNCTYSLWERSASGIASASTPRNKIDLGALRHYYTVPTVGVYTRMHLRTYVWHAQRRPEKMLNVYSTYMNSTSERHMSKTTHDGKNSPLPSLSTSKRDSGDRSDDIIVYTYK